MSYFKASMSQIQLQLQSNHSSQVPPPRQSYSPGGVTTFRFAGVSLMPPFTQQ